MQWDLLHMLAMNIELTEIHNIQQFFFQQFEWFRNIREHLTEKKWRSKVNEEDILVDQTRKRTLLYMLG